MMRAKAAKKACSMPNCDEHAKTSGMCSACYQWWNRCSSMSAAEFSVYLTRASYRAKRMVGRFSTSHKVTHRTARRKAA